MEKNPITGGARLVPPSPTGNKLKYISSLHGFVSLCERNEAFFCPLGLSAAAKSRMTRKKGYEGLPELRSLLLESSFRGCVIRRSFHSLPPPPPPPASGLDLRKGGLGYAQEPLAAQQRWSAFTAPAGGSLQTPCTLSVKTWWEVRKGTEIGRIWIIEEGEGEGRRKGEEGGGDELKIERDTRG